MRSEVLESSTRSETSEIVSVLRELVTLNRAILAALETHEKRPSHLTRDDRDRLSRILPAIGGACGSELFIASELLEHDSSALRLVLAGLNARQLGRLLQRAEGQRIGGFVVQRDGREVGAVLWRIVAAV